MDANDADHDRCASFFDDLDGPLVVPAPVIVELDWLGERRRVPARSVVLAGVLDGSLAVEDLTTDDYERVVQLCDKYDDLPLGFVDAAVIALAERFRERIIATLDHRHFAVVRPRHVKAFELVP